VPANVGWSAGPVGGRSHVAELLSTGRTPIHGDVKPSNILIDRARARMLLGDFGLAGTLVATHLQGTPAYMSPEAISGVVQDARSDLYALGVVLYELLTGTRPLTTASTLSAIFARRLSEAPPSPRQVDTNLPSELNAITVRLLAVDPADRFQTAAELGAALHALDRSRWWIAAPSASPRLSSPTGCCIPGRPASRRPQTRIWPRSPERWPGAWTHSRRPGR
jgi:serine/threonine protein kinase